MMAGAAVRHGGYLEKVDTLKNGMIANRNGFGGAAAFA
ncbi:Unknown protein sequence [Pseudomonas savastanoi pv. glycinea]|uniref:Uncharacterized protein n=1 Tax=Pseudomonas savastanoi pv. glycinea TaxID=318 RepID=A0ABR5LAE9_PSESG|nr:Unknown protein sequence [Pseudomonas amygdali pv. sesami]KPB40578.1 Unknown protein sequence [Pseudomonas savastanoi pv. phaseolicola]KPB62277.1 Unknown protein sequence [Pseudomonas amygdali pv. mellea]KPB85874.1 Unknown protein sequence [Pseudomonas syringae pv. maculicola]KPC22081.1 Unknown protein sequence [Pseudomonas savastanoi pv. glycinea]